MIKKTIFILSVLLTCTVSAQMKNTYKITGKVSDPLNNPIEFTEVVLFSEGSKIVMSDLTDEKGDFVLEAQKGSYKLQISEGNKLLFSKDIEVNDDLDLGNIAIDIVNQLKAVTVSGKKKLVERKVDRVIFNVENSINSSGGDAIDALTVTPGVRVQNDKITIIGKSTLAVMIDDKIVQLTEEDLANYLKSIPSNAIKSIEVFTTPPAKYEAAGNSGLVNIKLKKVKKDSWNALVGSTYIQRKYGDGSVMGNFNYNKNKLSISSGANFRKGTRYIEQDDYAYFQDGLWYTSSPFKKDYKILNANLNIDYQISSKWNIGTQMMVNKNNIELTDSPYTPVYDYSTNATISYLKSDGNVKQDPNIKALNLYNEFKIDSTGRKITLNLDYFNYNNNDTKQYNGISIIENPYSKQYYAGTNNNNQDITNLSGKLDLDYSVKWATLSFGGKVSNSKANNIITAFNSGLVNDPVVAFPLSQNQFEYTENIQAIYFSGNKKINSKWEAQFGLRMESTQTKTFAKNLNQETKNNYSKFFPTAYLSYTPTESSTFSLSYSRRIVRPSFYELNPNVYFINPFQTIEGNPFLQPAFVDNLELTYTYKKLESKFYYSYEDNLFFQIPIADPTTNFIRFTNENYINRGKLGVSENYVFDKFKWWTSNNAFDINYATSKSTLSFAEAQEGFNSRISTSNDIILNKDKSLQLNLNYWYSFQGVDGIYKNGAMSSTSVTVQYMLLNKDLKISLKGNDIFRTQKVTGNSVVNGIYQNFKYYYDTQYVQLSVSYKMGNKKIKVAQRETGNEEERSRTGN
ncbi:outer membrane receptor protein involved in Fe transport [Flavobacterium sp. 90]|uniref:TonB-dependent receptor domain-containing protein n=1 Tax=unclassified Flavobacterium TaxID=196869 RepID=UPI000EB0CC06|nr:MULTISPECIES: TonB-dependent receptor [unclassified Flavobacterium]RKR04558.1 outer membrane receptor protein involved in Fe transport [Flavobacterium sp. 81]TCK55887.1 outer membrane receptor protein involved in Fe transport [Flavobacterium sp. 90]